jgi:hypothetical protein
MIVVRVEVWPGGDRTRALELGQATIAGAPGKPRAVTISDHPAATLRQGFVDDDGEGAWELVRRALNLVWNRPRKS